MTAAAIALRGAVLAYQWTLRPVLGCNCRFHPSCSDYALDALRGHGAADLLGGGEADAQRPAGVGGQRLEHEPGARGLAALGRRPEEFAAPGQPGKAARHGNASSVGVRRSASSCPWSAVR